MSRRALTYLMNWLTDSGRKPMVIRGARQVGKTWLVRELAKVSGKTLIELNFEKNPQHQTFFESNDPAIILRQLASSLNTSINPEQTILFLDEIQAVPLLLSKLRWFVEDLPQLAVIAAGSLLDFVLDSHEFSMPVGRITYMHLGPLSFEEFLDANNKTQLLNYLQNMSWQDSIPLALHQQLMDLFKEYLIIGGMPAAAWSWAQHNSLPKVNQIHHDLLGTYRDDFAKYAGKIELSHLEEILVAIPTMLSKKFVFSHVNRDTKTATLKCGLHLLCQARIAHKVLATAGNGTPLAAEVNNNFFKVIFLDVGLVSAMLNLRFDKIHDISDINLINSGSISEQVAGQLFRGLEPFYVAPALYYWIREQKNSNAEIDYLIQQGADIIPVEIKSGSTGSLKSLHLFMALKKLSRALRINSELPNRVNIKTKTHQDVVEYKLYSLPFYLIEQIHRLL